MKKEPQTTTFTDPQEKPKARVPFFARHLNRETLRSIYAGDDLERKKPAQEVDTKI